MLELRFELVYDSFAQNAFADSSRVINQRDWEQILDASSGVTACEADEALDVFSVEGYEERRNDRHQWKRDSTNEKRLRVQLMLVNEKRLEVVPQSYRDDRKTRGEC